VTTAALDIAGVWKSYPDAVARTGRRGLRRRPRRWVLRDVDLTVGPGQMLGVVGANGAGKSTLLRIACGLSPADRGTVRAARGLVSVLTLGDLLDPDLSGAENAYSAGILAGLGPAAARRAVDEIIAFAELQAHADRAVRTYSDGMRLRLAFAGAVLADPPLLVMDEVIAIGDARFQGRCLQRIQQLRENGTAIVLASHDLDFIARTCERAVWLEDGALCLEGSGEEVVATYRRRVREQTAQLTPQAGPEGVGPPLGTSRFGSLEATVEAVALRGADGEPCDQLATGAPLTITGLVRPRSVGGGAALTIALTPEGTEAPLFELSSESARVPLDLDGGALDFAITLQRLDLAPGRWRVDVGLWEPRWTFAYDYHWHAYSLEVTGSPGGRGAALPPHSWRIRPAD